MKWLLGLCVVLCACTQAESVVDPISAKIQSLCAEGAPYAALFPTIGVYVMAACTADGIVKLAADSNGATWLAMVVGELKGSAVSAMSH
jgi:hypothetical protein